MEHRDNPEDSVTNQQLKTNEIIKELTKTLKEGIRTVPIPYRSTIARGDINSTPTTSLEFELVYEIKNPYKNTAIIKELALVPDAVMQLNGAVKILINKVVIYENTHTFFKLIGVDNIDYPNGLKIERDEAVQVFLKTNDVQFGVELAVRVLFTEIA